MNEEGRKSKQLQFERLDQTILGYLKHARLLERIDPDLLPEGTTFHIFATSLNLYPIPSLENTLALINGMTENWIYDDTQQISQGTTFIRYYHKDDESLRINLVIDASRATSEIPVILEPLFDVSCSVMGLEAKDIEQLISRGDFA